MIYKSAGMRGDLVAQLAFFDYFPKEHHVLILSFNPAFVSWPGHEHAGKCLNDNDVKNFNELLKPLDIEVINMEEANARGYTMEEIIDLDTWRKKEGLFGGDPLFSMRLAYNILPSNPWNIPKTGWFSAENLDIKNIEKHNKVVINRSMRYRTNIFNYGVLEKIKDKCVFMGNDVEYTDFCKMQFPVERKLFGTLKEDIAYLLGARALIGNQSFFYWLGESLALERYCEVYFPRIGGYTNGQKQELDADTVKGFYNV